MDCRIIVDIIVLVSVIWKRKLLIWQITQLATSYNITNLQVRIYTLYPQALIQYKFPDRVFNHIINIRRSWDRLIFITGIPVLVQEWSGPKVSNGMLLHDRSIYHYFTRLNWPDTRPNGNSSVGINNNAKWKTKWKLTKWNQLWCKETDRPKCFYHIYWKRYK